MTTKEQYDEILQQLREFSAEKPELAETIDFYCSLLETQAEVEVPQFQFEGNAESIGVLLQQRVPLLQAEELRIDWEAFGKLYEQICHLAIQYQPELSEEFAAIQSRLTDAPEEVKALLTKYLKEGQINSLEESNLNAELLSFVFNNALRPFLLFYRTVLAPLIDDSQWYLTFCPVCGGEPDFASLAKETGSRRLLCSRCDAEWSFQRVGCPFCGNEEQDKLGYYLSEDEVYRLYVCETCKRYLKTVDLRQTWREILLPVERIVTVDMDMAAIQAGYRRVPE